jgi:murein DD-endopeptidase MepM/ murein hydrolase activator NlpD
MRLAAAILIIIVIPLIWLQDLKAVSDLDVYLSSDSISQGDLILIRVKADKGEKVVVKWRGKEISLITNPDGTTWQGFLAADLKEKPGHYKAIVNLSTSGYKKKLEIEIVDKDYGMRTLTLPEEMVELDKETLKRVRKESNIINGLWEAPASTPVWGSFFMRPVDGDVIGVFGTGSIINNQPRSPHTGVDLMGEEGTPVKAINDGKVILICDHFFTGKSIFLDHGGQVISMYFHLKEIDVKQDDIVRKGQIIGLVGSTGRVTGPHIHWGIRVNGARINPLSLIDLSRELEE